MFEVLFANWGPPCRVLVENISEWFALFFLFYRCVIGFAVLNVVGARRTAITTCCRWGKHLAFRDKEASRSSRHTLHLPRPFSFSRPSRLHTSDEELAYRQKEKEIQAYTRKVRKLFQSMDDSGHGCSECSGSGTSLDGTIFYNRFVSCFVHARMFPPSRLYSVDRCARFPGTSPHLLIIDCALVLTTWNVPFVLC